jgi:hypothetical protein
LFAHTVLGCGIGAIKQDSSDGCAPGAMGALVAKVWAKENDAQIRAESATPEDANKTILDQSTFAGTIAGCIVGGSEGCSTGGMTGNNAILNNHLTEIERKKLQQAETDCYTKKDQSACATASNLKKKDELSDKLLANAVATCKGPECNEVTNVIRQEMAKQGCTPPRACPDYTKLNEYWQVAQAKAQGLEPVYPEAWLLDGKAVLDLGKWGIKAVSGSGKGSLDALSQLNKTDTAKVNVNARVDDFEQYDKYRKPDSTRTGGEWDWQKQAPNNGAVPGTQQTVTIESGTVDRFGPRGGEYFSPAGTPYEARALPPGKQAEPYEQYQVLKPFTVTQETIAPAFGQTGGGLQMRASIPEVQNGFATIDDLIKHGYLKDPKK